ncbi:MAG TPA: hypothetical protein DEA08_32650, partial [Planctomycetes bacterium]|nr:hypothetical protein [Planctomycetota bacterium]
EAVGSQAGPGDSGAFPRVPDSEQATGVRTFALLALVGALSALSSSTWVLPVGFLAVSGLLIASYVIAAEHGDLGLTSKVAALIVFLVGALCGQGETTLASAAAIGVAFLLSHKQRLHRFARKLRQQDVEAVVKFAAVSVIVLPLLPTEPVSIASWFSKGEPDPDSLLAALTLDLRKVWWMVVLISSISFAGYLTSKLLGAHRGLLVTSAVGGLVSSTAVSVTYADRSHEAPQLTAQLAKGILIANLIMPLRVLVVLLVVAPRLVPWLAAPMLLTSLAGGLAALVIHLRDRESAADDADVDLRNPFELAPALQFGALFALILLLAHVLEGSLGEKALYGLALASGLTDVDAINLATAELVEKGQATHLAGTLMITLAVLSNTAFKGAVVVFRGARQLRVLGVLAFGGMLLAALAGLAAVWLWVS